MPGPIVPTLTMLIISCAAIAGPGVGPECHVGVVGGVPTFVFDGLPHSGICYSTYDTHPPRLEVRAREFGQAGCHLYNFVVEIAGYGYSHPMWTGPDTWDFNDLDVRAHTVIAADPKAQLLPRIYIDAPKWWRDANPEEMMVLGNGKRTFGEKYFALQREGDYPSLASEKWRRDMCAALGKVIEHIEASDYGDRIVGYQLSGQKTEEWYHWSMNAPLLGDYSPHMVAAFRRWLGARYGSDERLREAWGGCRARACTAPTRDTEGLGAVQAADMLSAPRAQQRDDGGAVQARALQRLEVSLATAAIPSQAERFGDQAKTFRDPVKEAAVIDFHRFWSDVMADTIDRFAGAVKEKTGRQKLVGAFYAYTLEFAGLAEDAGHLALGKLERSPNVDFVMAPSSYYNRNLPGKPYFRLPIQSLQAHGKVFWNDFDQVSYKYYDKLKEDPNLKTWEYQMGLTQTPEQFVWMCRREVGMELAQGVQLAHFDIHGGYYDDPVIMAGVRELANVRQEALALPERCSDAQILVLADEDSEHYVSFRNPIQTALLSAQTAEMPFVAPYDTALLSDLGALDTARYRLIVLLNAFRLDEAQRRLIARKLKGEAKTVVWLYAPGYFDESGASAANIADACGIAVRPIAGAGGDTARTVERGARQGTELALPRGQQFEVTDAQAEALALRVNGPRSVVVARREFGDWHSIYSACVPLPAEMLKGIARRAGVHIYDDDPRQIVFANRHFLTVCDDGRGGEARVHLARKGTVTDTATGATLCRDASSVRVSLRPKEVRLLRVQ